MSTLVVEVAALVGADVIIRGLRVVSDFEFELQMAQMNRQLSGIEKHSSSRQVRPTPLCRAASSEKSRPTGVMSATSFRTSWRAQCKDAPFSE